MDPLLNSLREILPHGYLPQKLDHRLERRRIISQNHLDLTEPIIKQRLAQGEPTPSVEQLRQYRTSVHDEYCDATPHTIAATEVMGRRVDRACPYCHRRTLVEIYWVYGSAAGRLDSTVRSIGEIRAELAKIYGSAATRLENYPDETKNTTLEISIHEVEVCTHCHWQFLLVQYLF